MRIPKSELLDRLMAHAFRRDLLTLLLVAFLLRTGYLILMLNQVRLDYLLVNAPDTEAYVRMAKGFLGLCPPHDDAIMMFGIGYGAFLAGMFFICGIAAMPVLLVQICLSSCGCLLLYKLGKELTGSRAVGLVAGYLAATSFTSISQATFVLSDCLFFFLILLGTLLFLFGLKRCNRWYFIVSGFSIGGAILTRSIGQYWPLFLITLALVVPSPTSLRWRLADRLALFRRALIAPLIAIIIMSAWMARNYAVYGIPMLAFTSAGGPANVARLALENIYHQDSGEIMNSLMEDRQKETGDTTVSLTDRYPVYKKMAWAVFRRYPRESLKVYLSLIWENLNATNQLYGAQLPITGPRAQAVIGWWEKIHYLNFWLSMAGLMLMLGQRHWRPLIFLGLTYGYFAAMIGFTRWQGSRLFYPGQIAWSIIIAFLIVTIAGWLGRLCKTAIQSRGNSLSP